MTTEIVKYEASKPVQSKRTLQGLLEGQMDAIRSVLPAHLSPERLLKTLFLAVNRQPELLACTQESVMQGIMQSAELGLDLSPARGEAYLVPFKVKGKQQAQFIPGYRGLAKLARQAEPSCRIEAEIVHENDDFTYIKGSEPEVRFAPMLSGDRGKVIGAYALYQRTPEDPVQAEWMDTPELDRIRSRSKAAKAGPWVTDTNEMRRKTVWRRLFKWIPASSDKQFQAAVAAMERADEVEFGMEGLIEAPVEQDGERTEKLAEKVTASETDEPDQAEPADGELFPEDEKQTIESEETADYFVEGFKKLKDEATIAKLREELTDDEKAKLTDDDKKRVAEAYSAAIARARKKK